MKSINLKSVLTAAAIAFVSTSINAWALDLNTETSVNADLGTNSVVSGNTNVNANTNTSVEPKAVYNNARNETNASGQAVLNQSVNTKARMETSANSNYSGAKKESNSLLAGVNSKVNVALDSQVDAAVQSNSSLAGTSVKAKVKNGQVTLKGKVRTEAQRMAAEQSAKAVNGVNSVKNNIKVDANMKASM